MAPIAPIAFVVDRHALALHPRLQDRNQRRTIARHSHRLIDAIFKQIADFAARGAASTPESGRVIASLRLVWTPKSCATVIEPAD